ncbi:MAG: diacylglyceryl transferase [Flavobacteriaceae bacterium]|nr:diacylglyceryl transferase [Flavobacteriaceae bacterium]
MNKLKKHWGINSNTQAVIILLVFAVNGTLSALLSRFLLKTLQVNKANFSNLIYYIFSFLFLTLVYFLLLSITSRVFGQGDFFRNFAKKSLKHVGLHHFIL